MLEKAVFYGEYQTVFNTGLSESNKTFTQPELRVIKHLLSLN
jgi:hypothetical protein